MKTTRVKAGHYRIKTEGGFVFDAKRVPFSSEDWEYRQKWTVGLQSAHEKVVAGILLGEFDTLAKCKARVAQVMGVEE